LCRIINFKSISAHAATGKQGVLGPTKIYLAVQPAQSSNNNQQQQSPTTQVSSVANTPVSVTPKQQQSISPSSTNGIYTFNSLLSLLFRKYAMINVLKSKCSYIIPTK